MKKVVVLILLALSCWFLFAACAPDGGVLRVGVKIDVPRSATRILRQGRLKALKWILRGSLRKRSWARKTN